MKKIALISCLLILCFFCFSQTRIDAKIDTVNYPKNITFIWNEYSLEKRDKSEFILVEKEVPIPFDFKCLPKNVENRNKTVLFLWENAPTDRNQNVLFKNVLINFFEQNANRGDKFDVVVFDRKTNDRFLTSLNNNLFVSPTENLSSVKNHTTKIPCDGLSDVYDAIQRGLNILQKQKDNTIKILVVLAAGKNPSGAGTNSIAEGSISFSKDNKIPVYVIHHPRLGPTYIQDIAEKTFGKTISTFNQEEISTVLAEWYNAMAECQAGFDYHFTFNSKYSERDGILHINKLKIGNKVVDVQFQAPNKENLSLFIGILVLIVALLAVATIFILKIIKKRRIEQDRINKEHEQELAFKQTELERIEREGKELKREIANKEEAERRAKEEAKQKAEREELEKKLNARARFPRLIGKCDGIEINFELNCIETTIGRKQENNIVLTPDTVSGRHAKIVFEGNDFEIFDTDSTNHVIVNGIQLQRKKLKNMDIIGLGEVILTYFE